MKIMENNDRDTMLERGEIILNGYKFTVRPIYLGEESDYMNDVSYVIYPHKKDGQEPTEKDMSRYAIALFRNNSDDSEKKKIRFIDRIKYWIAKHFTHNYEYYYDSPNILGLVKWIERKVYYKGRPVHFYNLERKFKLNKSEIIQLFGFFQEISGF